MGVRMSDGGLLSAVFAGTSRTQERAETFEYGDNATMLITDLAMRHDDPCVVDGLIHDCMAVFTESVRPPFEPILMNQDDSKQWGHLLSQENHPIWSDLAYINLNLSSMRSRSISSDVEMPKKASRGWELTCHEHKNG